MRKALTIFAAAMVVAGAAGVAAADDARSDRQGGHGQGGQGADKADSGSDPEVAASDADKELFADRDPDNDAEKTL